MKKIGIRQFTILVILLAPGFATPVWTADLLKPVSTAPKGMIIFNHRSDQIVGAKGEEQYDLSTTAASCGESVQVFDHARIVFRERRFGEAQIITTPAPGCVRCAPLIVRWYHEPTGYLDYQLQVYQREITGLCQD